MNWTEAVQYCTERNATLVSSPTQATQTGHGMGYWTRKHRRLSPWIHVIGCFNETWIDQSVNKTLTSTSVVMCQQKCSIEHFTFFGLQNTSCVCLSDHFSVTEAIDPRSCNTSCSTSEILNDCGGPGTYSVYKAGDLVFFDEHDLNATYMAVKCSETTRKFVYLHYSTLTFNCQCRRPGTELNDTVYSNWNLKDCYNKCRELGLYLHGDYNVMDPDSACHGIKTGSVETWVGIVRQNFTSSSFGMYKKNVLETTTKPTISSSLAPTTQTSTSSSLAPTSQSSTSRSLAPTSQTSTSSSLALTSQTSTSSSLAPTSQTLNQASSVSSNSFLKNYNKDNQIELREILLAVCGTIVAVLAVIGLFLLYTRRQKRNSLKRDQGSCRGQSDGASTDDERINKTNGYSNFELSPVKRGPKNLSQDNVSYDCLSEANEKKHGANLNIYANSVPSYSDQNSREDLSYDHLWQTPTGGQADDTYDHADDANSHRASDTTEDTYTHAGSVTNHGFATTSDDYYSHTDCATNKGSSATTDDTYDHARGATNHGFATTADDTYSHTVLDGVSYLATTDDTYSIPVLD
ncbi:uncharacterized protein LOC128164772 [Crassostrea angulata]|uniref:uncharacterized protein LOC128164772 n=1 Tax=Magallana angulata TaxID=2784310 RepID=UPI0022B109BD|nr:uncharacterized protein LOC128164772 [Crassostrea angulata]